GLKHRPKCLSGAMSCPNLRRRCRAAEGWSGSPADGFRSPADRLPKSAGPDTTEGAIDCPLLPEERSAMKSLQVVTKTGTKARLKTLLKNTERHLRGNHTTFRRMREGRWKHVKYPGWVQWDDAPGNLLVAEIQTKVKDHEWQMLHAFIGYLDRHLGGEIE